VRLYCTAAPDRAMKFVIGITAKSIPYVERIGEDYVVLLKRASARQEIAYILYTRYPDRSRTSELTKWIPNHSSSNVRLSLANMRKAKLVHSDSGGYVLTVLGIKAVEQEITRNSS
jgi:predicted transcriptional regulator with HTH domain